jgi:hypothetical protein
VAVNIMLLRPAARMIGSAIAVKLRMVYLLLWFTLADILPVLSSSGRVGWKHQNWGRKYAD